ncbi:UDP-glucose 6-dehydrogenase [Candidatus Roizmanbacteria bacterium RIFCSPLOWO2_12_FULL_40_12]|uniref:UDP-glucose 6-dehydrogenase n=1 Tax=Candidatus Roizmanbacteria bacterium RIFCSPLOWO2_01_FULL_40_42 TaxID=1802066 RepID=A0A1F7J4F4_9BACT|nr:MAG: UDP-glucose 6-dehydrogenase [Candidatus Roizmanbacteria bacterium RIFCSPHIGHO2_01_FULL_40_98]OGK27259.1 MAG: UDP-glucose 6-dehydrogenase [Candidatus Roizmanbacteria bacterium RIFCSPHIGHO2_02_FULL_40_53]OGK36364.1 MAG: UDP-glucose 6-dehydrogenase [Candidatus Roizmanbacteria bacterium RIFCSPHIGHO2_12_FULL_40_130]OGK50492.1 MAG: UDP-glucose 6-dehydrogenase [Candidatus Roizmanbacteria bacterium RIFCSPLOWO2_01_FULL_40_42]OGK58586.1 MAG: UDP-glucose 6-dehydrogenase [Candidatus Roizmanbacteria
MTITFIGHGYVGLVTACVFADFGNKVWIIGHTEEKLKRLKSGDPIIYEPGLKELLEKNLQTKRIHITKDYDTAVAESDIVFIAVGTPPKKSGEADLTSVFEVAEKISKHLKDGTTVVSCKSTVPVGTNKKVEAILQKNKKSKAEILTASCPEFLREGTAIYDTLNPDRVVVGSDSKKAIDILLELHKPINGKRVITNLASAELIKYASNAMLATKISFANFVSFYCEETGADVEKVLDAVGLDNRIGRVFLYPGVGYGGSCLPKDVKALIDSGKTLGVDTSLLQEVEDINETARKNFLQKLFENFKGKKIAVWGLSFKPNTDDIRFAPSLYILQAFLDKNLQVSVYDPVAIENVKKLFKNQLTYAKDPYEVLKEADALCILTEWNEFKQIDLKKVKGLLKNPLVFDGRNMYDPKKMAKLGFSYFGIGRNL